MVNWMSPEEIQNEAQSFNNLMHCLVGLYMWEFFCSLDFEWAVITGKRRFRWPMVFYFLGRYTLFSALIGILVALNVNSPSINCEALYTFNQFTGDATVGFASINLALRTIAIYKNDKRVIGALIVLIIGHWAVIFAGISLTATYIEGTGCAIIHTKANMISAVFIYSMGFDFIILCLSTYKLAFPLTGRSELVRLLFKDGLIFFLVAFIANAIATVFMLLNLNPIMSIIFNVPAAIAATIVASRTVRRLSNFTSSGPEMFNASNNPGSSGGLPMTRPRGLSRPQSDGVHVRMDTFVKAEGGDRGSDSTYEVAGAGRKAQGLVDEEMGISPSTLVAPPSSRYILGDSEEEEKY